MNRRTALTLAGVAALGSVAPVAAQAPPPARAPHQAAASTSILKMFINDVLNSGNVPALDDMLDPGFKTDNPSDAPGPEAFKARVTQWLQTIGYQVKHTVFSWESIVVDSGNAVARGYITGASNSGKAIRSTYFVELTILKGKITGAWLTYDFGATMG